jgi:TPR repeat protein
MEKRGNHFRNDDAEAMTQLGLIYDRENENDKALFWYQKAADAGHAYGKERLAFLQKWTNLHK